MTTFDVPTIAGLVAAAAVLACIRFVISEQFNGPFPYGTLTVNVTASFLAGAATQLDGPWATIVTVGALGTLSTWSAVAIEAGRMAREGEGSAASLYVVATVTTGLLAAWIGIQIGSFAL